MFFSVTMDLLASWLEHGSNELISSPWILGINIMTHFSHLDLGLQLILWGKAEDWSLQKFLLLSMLQNILLFTIHMIVSIKNFTPFGVLEYYEHHFGL